VRIHTVFGKEWKIALLVTLAVQSMVSMVAVTAAGPGTDPRAV